MINDRWNKFCYKLFVFLNLKKNLERVLSICGFNFFITLHENKTVSFIFLYKKYRYT